MNIALRCLTTLSCLALLVSPSKADVVNYTFTGTVSNQFSLTGDSGNGINAGDSWTLEMLVDTDAPDMQGEPNFGDYNAILEASISFASGFEQRLTFVSPQSLTVNNDRPAFLGGSPIDRILANGTDSSFDSFSVRTETADQTVLVSDSLIGNGTFFFDDSGDDEGSLDWSGTGLDGQNLEFSDAGIFGNNDYGIQLSVSTVPEPSSLSLVFAAAVVALAGRRRES